ncbi:MAG: 4Fe-4S binding protein [Candidatus Auribacterota bacterium]|jgi:ferredoxin|nr:4Fe-4S binding protein [Candidatus Auribacterota bacterium]
MKRKIITIDEEKCNGCAQCIPNCPEGALQIIDGKARLISDLFCDGLGACIGTCPQGAITIEERDAEPYNETKVMANVVKGGANVIYAHLKHLKDHNETEFFNQAVDYLKNNNIPIPQDQPQCVVSQNMTSGCPGSQNRVFNKDTQQPKGVNNPEAIASELRQWPIQLQLINPHASFFDNADLLIAADCAAFSYGNFHQRFLKDKILIIFCPKLDSVIDVYIDKLTTIFTLHIINSITLVHMEVPCCSGIERVVREALKRANRTYVIKDYTISLQGDII